MFLLKTGLRKTDLNYFRGPASVRAQILKLRLVCGCNDLQSFCWSIDPWCSIKNQIWFGGQQHQQQLTLLSTRSDDSGENRTGKTWSSRSCSSQLPARTSRCPPSLFFQVWHRLDPGWQLGGEKNQAAQEDWVPTRLERDFPASAAATKLLSVSVRHQGVSMLATIMRPI